LSPSRWLLCGGIGSGKSAVRGFLEEHGVHTIDSDSVGHEVLARGGAAVAEVVATWPSVLVDGNVDRDALGRIVFADPEELRKLEGLTHPHIFSLIENRVRSLDGTVVVEVPLLRQPFESPWPRMVVDAPKDLRIKRATAKGMDRDDVARRMKRQPSRREWLAVADLVIPNCDDMDDLESVVAEAISFIRGA
jgi:dephospho-CoA kinase